MAEVELRQGAAFLSCLAGVVLLLLEGSLSSRTSSECRCVSEASYSHGSEDPQRFLFCSPALPLGPKLCVEGPCLSSGRFSVTSLDALKALLGLTGVSAGFEDHTGRSVT